MIKSCCDRIEIAKDLEGVRRRRCMPLRRAGRVGRKGGAGGAGNVAQSAQGNVAPACRAMRYYRLWIYACNAALLIASLTFCAAAARTLLFDYRRHLLPSSFTSLYQPSFLYAYLALATQGGALQLLGCMGAVRLNEKLLNAYWLLLLLLLFGDVVLGAFWAFKFEKIRLDLRPALRARLWRDYETDADFAYYWDRLQDEERCCGISTTTITTTITTSTTTTTTTTTEVPSSSSSSFVAAISTTSAAPSTSEIVINATKWRGPWDNWPNTCCQEKNVNNTKCLKIYNTGCEEKLLKYLKDTASVLAIIGYCVMAFLKICFVGILRYEIREMIQKIRLLRAEVEVEMNGSIGHACATDSERESLLHSNNNKTEISTLLSSPPSGARNNISSSLFLSQQQQQQQPPNGNNNYEMRECSAFNNNNNINNNTTTTTTMMMMGGRRNTSTSTTTTTTTEHHNI